MTKYTNLNALQYPRKMELKVANTPADAALGSGTSVVLSSLTAAEDRSLRTVFHIRRGDWQTPNTADIRVYNVAPETYHSLQSEQIVTLQAGYEGNFGIIFQGRIVQVRNGREDQLNTYVDLTAVDGDEAYNYSFTAFNLARGNPPLNSLAGFIRTLASSGINADYHPFFKDDGSIRGTVHYGMTRDELRLFASQNDCTWHFDNNELVLIPKLSYVPGVFPVLAFDSGLVGIPEQTDQGLEMTLLLNPSIRIGQCVKLDNKSALNKYRWGTEPLNEHNFDGTDTRIRLNDDGLYYVMVAEHHGDSRGSDWYTEITCQAVDATVPIDSAPNAVIIDGAQSRARGPG